MVTDLASSPVLFSDISSRLLQKVSQQRMSWKDFVS